MQGGHRARTPCEASLRGRDLRSGGQSALRTGPDDRLEPRSVAAEQPLVGGGDFVATFIRATLHRYSAFAFVQRNLKVADMLIGAALFNARQTGLDKQQAVQEKLATLAVYREGINAHLTAAVALAEPSPAGLTMPNQSLLHCVAAAGACCF